MTRKELGDKAVSLIQKHNNVALLWATSVGKSSAAIQMMNYLHGIYNSKMRVLLVVAETAHKKNWADELLKWKARPTHITMECYASLKNYNNTQWDLIIFDEAHHLASDIRQEILKSLKTKNTILLSATLPDQLIQTLNIIFGKFAISEVTLKQAIDTKILPKPKVCLIPLTLDNTKKNQIIIEEWGKKEKRVIYRCEYSERWAYLRNRVKYPNATLKIVCTEKEKYTYINEQFEYWKKRYLNTRNEIFKNKFLRKGSERKRFLGDLKTPYAEILIGKLANTRFICFCAGISQADELGNLYSIHSEKINVENTIKDFNDKRINQLFAVGMLQEGQNLKDIEAGIIIQLDGQERPFIQKLGRAMRADYPVQYIFYYKDTKDEDYLKNVYEEIPHDFIVELNNLNEL